MMTIKVNEASIEDLEQMQAKLRRVLELVGAQTGGLEEMITLGVLQLDRFVAANIEVDTGRTKNSIFPSVHGDGNRVTGQLATNVWYAPWVRDAGHDAHFFDYAEKKEVPAVLAMLGSEFSARVEQGFE